MDFPWQKHHWKSILILTCLIVSSGCDALVTQPSSPIKNTQPEGKNPKVTRLEEQNAELMQMLEEAESRLHRKLDEIDEREQQLEIAQDRLQKSEQQRTSAIKQMQSYRRLLESIKVDLEMVSAISTRLEQIDSLLESNPDLSSSDMSKDEVVTRKND